MVSVPQSTAVPARPPSLGIYPPQPPAPRLQEGLAISLQHPPFPFHACTLYPQTGPLLHTHTPCSGHVWPAHRPPYLPWPSRTFPCLAGHTTGSRSTASASLRVHMPTRILRTKLGFDVYARARMSIHARTHMHTHVHAHTCKRIHTLLC